jgi:hypothetical protein
MTIAATLHWLNPSPSIVASVGVAAVSAGFAPARQGALSLHARGDTIMSPFPGAGASLNA